MVSLKDIAKECGVSPSSVSKALNGHKDISEVQRKRIIAMADAMGYMPNVAARSLKTNRTYNLGVLFTDKTQSGLTHEYFSNILESFKVEAEKHGYVITFISPSIGGKRIGYYEHCKYRGYDGVMIASVDFKSTEVIQLIEGNIPVVTIDHLFNDRMAILSDNVDGMNQLVQYIYKCGHKKIAFIHGEDTSVTQKRLASFYKTCEELGLHIPDAYVLEALYHDPKTTSIRTKELLSLNEPPTCIIFPDDFSSIGGMSMIKDSGLRIPEDISVVGYDGIYLSGVLEPALTTLKQNTRELGSMAAIKLIELIEHPKTAIPSQIVIKGELLPGGSVKKL